MFKENSAEELTEERKLKEYIYDSLCLRYKIAREAQARHEVNTHYNGNIKTAIEAAKRDEMRFYQILDDVIFNMEGGSKI
jgi:hypothetical protein